MIDQDSLTEMVTTKGGEGDTCTSYRKVFRRENVKCKDSNVGAPGVWEEKPGGQGDWSRMSEEEIIKEVREQQY